MPNARPSAPDKSSRWFTPVAVVGFVVIIAVSAWSFMERTRPTEPLVRKTSDFIVTWRCLGCDNTADQPAGPGPIECSKCHKKEMYASIRWGCPVHGAVPVAFQYNEEGDPTEIKIGKEAWKPATDAEGAWNIRCPKCNAVMMPAQTARPRSQSPS